LQELAGHVHTWQETVFSFDEKLQNSEQEAYRRVRCNIFIRNLKLKLSKQFQEREIEKC